MCDLLLAPDDFYSKLERCCFNVGKLRPLRLPPNHRCWMAIPAHLCAAHPRDLPALLHCSVHFYYISSSPIILLTLSVILPLPQLSIVPLVLETSSLSYHGWIHRGLRLFCFSLLMPLTRPISVQEEEEPRDHLTIRNLTD